MIISLVVLDIHESSKTLAKSLNFPLVAAPLRERATYYLFYKNFYSLVIAMQYQYVNACCTVERITPFFFNIYSNFFHSTQVFLFF